MLAAGFFAACQPQTESGAGSGTMDSTKIRVDRGAYLVNMAGCTDCHTPFKMTEQGPVKDTDFFLAGHPEQTPLPPADSMTASSYVLFHPAGTAMRGPWGTSFAANLTPSSTGLGNWTEDQFIRAMRHGDYKGLPGGRKLLPPMPWQNYAGMTDEDLRAVFAYLKTINPVENRVPAPLAP